MTQLDHPAASLGGSLPTQVEGDASFWHGLIDEQAAAAFLSLTIRTLQGWRYRGGGPQYVRVSARCIRYRRSELRDFADARMRTSTTDPGPEREP